MENLWNIFWGTFAKISAEIPAIIFGGDPGTLVEIPSKKICRDFRSNIWEKNSMIEYLEKFLEEFLQDSLEGFLLDFFYVFIIESVGLFHLSDFIFRFVLSFEKKRGRFVYRNPW